MKRSNGLGVLSVLAPSAVVTAASLLRPALLSTAAAFPAVAAAQDFGPLAPLWTPAAAAPAPANAGWPEEPAGGFAPSWGAPAGGSWDETMGPTEFRPASAFGEPSFAAGPTPGAGEALPPAPPGSSEWSAGPDPYFPSTIGRTPAASAPASSWGGAGASFAPPPPVSGPQPFLGGPTFAGGAPPLIAPPLACEGSHYGRLYGTPEGPPLDMLSRALSVRLDTPTSAALLDFQNRQTDKQLLLLGSIPTVVPHPILVPGAQMRLSALYGRTNARGKFGYLGRFPPDFTGNTAGDLRILQANLAATAYFTSWASGYAETLFSDVFSFPTPNQGSFQVRQAYATFGNVREFPLYAFIGKKTVSYGDFGTLSPFTQAVPWHYFAALGEGAGVGYVSGGLHVVLTGLSGGRGIRTVDSPAQGKVNNFAINASYAGRAGGFEYLVGAGYLDGTIYNADTPEHTDRNAFGPQNGAWDVNGTLRYRRAIFAAEYVQTNKSWPVTDYEVSAWKAEGAYDVAALGRPLRLSTSYSVGKQARTDLPFDRNAQLVLGAGWQLRPNALLSLEYVRSIGFAPLIGLTRPGVSDRDVRQNSLVLGVSLVL